MSDPGPPIAYASRAAELPADRLLRRILAWSAIFYGAQGIISNALLVALAKKWMASPRNIGWGFGRDTRDVILIVADTLVMSALIIAGILILKRGRVGVIVLRAAVISAIVRAVLYHAISALTIAEVASCWSTPGAAAMQALGILYGLWIPVLLGLLTLPPLARRIL